MFYITSLCSSKKRITDVVPELAQLGFKNIELTGGIEFSQNIEKDLFDLKKEYHLDFLIHNYFPPQANDFYFNLAAEDHNLKRKVMNLIKQAVALSRKLGKELYSIHSGFSDELDSDSQKKSFYQVINFILDEIALPNFKIAIENLCPRPFKQFYSLITKPGDIEEFLDYYKNRPNLGLLLDIGHLEVAGSYFNFNAKEALNNLFSKYHDKIFEVHLSENGGQGDFHDISSIDSWQIEFLTNNAETLKDINIVFEWRNSANPLTYQKFNLIKNKLIS